MAALTTTPLEDEILETFDTPPDLRAGLMAVFMLGRAHEAATK